MTVRTKSVAASPLHEKLRARILAVLKNTAADMPADEILAVVCVLVGQLIAMQDQRRFSSAAVMTLVSSNIEVGNKAAIDELLNAPGGRA